MDVVSATGRRTLWSLQRYQKEGINVGNSPFLQTGDMLKLYLSLYCTFLLCNLVWDFLMFNNLVLLPLEMSQLGDVRLVSRPL